jgi:hypothetical protein
MIVGTGGFDPESALADSLLRWQSRLTALLTGPCLGYMQTQAALINPPPPPDPVYYYGDGGGGGGGGGGDGAL